MSALGDPSDKVAGLDQFQPTLTKRGGKGSVVFEGATFSRMDWIMRSARLGHTLAAGEGQLLAEHIDALTRECDDTRRDADTLAESIEDYIASQGKSYQDDEYFQLCRAVERYHDRHALEGGA
jgi:hypothetical protein